MREECIALGIALQHLGNFCLDNFSDRILVQKKIYCAQMLGVDFGFSFNWYLRGPYSPGLTSLAFEAINQGPEQLSNYHLNEEVTSKLDIVNTIANDGRKMGLSEVSWLELVASVHYLTCAATWIKKRTKDAIWEKLHEYKPKYTQTNFEKAWETLTDYRVLPAT